MDVREALSFDMDVREALSFDMDVREAPVGPPIHLATLIT